MTTMLGSKKNSWMQLASAIHCLRVFENPINNEPKISDSPIDALSFPLDDTCVIHIHIITSSDFLAIFTSTKDFFNCMYHSLVGMSIGQGLCEGCFSTPRPTPNIFPIPILRHGGILFPIPIPTNPHGESEIHGD